MRIVLDQCEHFQNNNQGFCDSVTYLASDKNVFFLRWLALAHFFAFPASGCSNSASGYGSFRSPASMLSEIL